MKLKKEKCMFLVPEVKYLGHKISNRGIEPTEEKVRAVTKAPVPQNVSELKAFIGLVNYYGKFLSNLASPLCSLLCCHSVWKWGSAQQEAFESSKDLLKSPRLFAHYDGSKELVLACDTSPYGVGAVLSHCLDNGEEQLITFASRTLSTTERNYSQLDKEALAVIVGVRKFHQYHSGKRFIIHTDYKPLMHLFGEHRGIPQLASARIQRWGLILGIYTYSVQYKPGKELQHANGLSRLPLPDTLKSVCSHPP